MRTLPRWFWPLALICFLLLFFLCISRNIPRIQSLLSLRSMTALKDQGISLENVIFKGRDANLYGTVASQDIVNQAVNTVSDVTGVRRVNNFLKIDPALLGSLGVAGGAALSAGPLAGLLPALSTVNMAGAVAPTFAGCKALNDQEKVNLQAEFDRLAAELPEERFAVGTIVVSPELAAHLDKIVALLKQDAFVKAPIRVVGYTDSALQSEFNQCLSLGRAASVYQYLVDQGVDPNCLSLEAAGERDAMASNETKEGRMLNRRFEFKLEEVK
ncbi:MAG: OmpA family protein [Deinococcales bacterium]